MIPNSDFTVINGAGHWPQWEKVEEFNDVLTSYLLEQKVVAAK